MTDPGGEQVLRGLITQLQIDKATLLRIADTIEQRPCPTVAEAMTPVLATLREPTRSAYRCALERLAERAGERPLSDITVLELRQWTAQVEAEAMNDPRARHGRGAAERFVDACRCLFRNAVETGWIVKNPALGLSRPPRPQSSRRALRSDELMSIFDVAISTGRDPQLDLLLLWFARETGARREGVLGLRIDQIDLAAPSVRLMEKNRHTRELPITRDLSSALLAHREERAPTCDRILHYRNGVCVTSRRLDGLFARIHGTLPWADNLGLSLHWLRHTTLTDIQRVAGERVAQAYAGHSDDARGVTGVYTKVDFSELEFAHSQVFASNHEEKCHARPTDSSSTLFDLRRAG